METHEKVAFLKFFITYFVSVALLILASGYFYFSQMKNSYLKAEEFSMIEYARHIKMGDSLHKYADEYRHKYVELPNKHIDIRNFTNEMNEFSKYIPMNHNLDYLVVYKTKKNFIKELAKLKILVISVQIILLILFALISYFLAKSALKPLQKSIVTLDAFAKDLIHDLNTPVTSIKLNLKLIEKIPELQENKALSRLKKSVDEIGELHQNLTTLLQEETFQISEINICTIVQEVVETQKQIYKEVHFSLEYSNMRVKVNVHAMKQILQNIISNACKYNKKDGFVKIYTRNNVLYIEDGGKGIAEPKKIFERSYSRENSSGIGLDIVKRLAYAMNIKIEVTSSAQGSVFALAFA